MVYAEYSEMCATVGNRLEISAVAGQQRDVYVEDIEVARHTDPVIAHRSGLLLQRCGGGVRVLKKRIGGA